MAHRIVKKTNFQQNTQQYQPNHKETNSQPPSFQNGNLNQNKQSIRPFIHKTDQIYKHDKSSYRKSTFAFPSADSLFTSENNYDAGPNFIRPTSAVMMGNPKKRYFPYGAWITPFGSEKVHTLRVDRPLRCSRCKAYVNPHFRFDGTKSTAICNICGIKFAIEGKVDNKNIESSQIMTEGIIDFVVSDDIYMRKRRDIVKIIIAIEVGPFMWESGIFHTIIQASKSAIQNTQFGSKVRVGVTFFNSEGIKFMKLRNRKGDDWKEKQPIVYQIKNSTVGFCCPLSDEQMLYDPNTEKQKIIYLLDNVVNFAEKHYQTKYGTGNVNYYLVLKCLEQNFVKETGRVMLFAFSDPKSGLCPIRPRKQQQNVNQLKPLMSDYYNYGKQLAKAKLGVDLYMFSKDSLINHELATTHFLSSLTGGNLYFYSLYSHQNHSQQLYYTVYANLSKNYVYDVDFTVRVSNGLNICGYGVGEGFRESRDISLSMMDPASSVSVTFEHEQKIEESSAAYLQYAMMYTTGNGERRLRVINYRYPIVNNIEVLYEAVDYLAFSNLLCREYLSKLARNPSQKVREEFVNRLRAILGEYWGQSTRRQSNIHPNLGPAFAYIHTILNSKIFLNWLKSTPDNRICQILKVHHLNFNQFANKFYPKLYSISMDIYEGELMPGDYIQANQEEEEEIAIIPENLPLMRNSIKNDGVYLYQSNEEMLILVQSDASSELLMDLFGTDDWGQIEENGLPELETSHNIRVNIIINELRRRNSENKGIYLPVLVRTPKKKGPFNDLIKNICKQNYDECTYNNFLDILNRKNLK